MTSNLRAAQPSRPDPRLPQRTTRRRVAHRRARPGRRASGPSIPRFNVALEASAGTGKTRVLVDRYVNLLQGRRRSVEHPGDHLHAQGRGRDARADPDDAARRPPREARSRRRAGAICATAPATSPSARSTPSVCRCSASSRSRPTSTPASTMADETEVPRLIDESLDRALRVCRGLAREDEHVALVFAQLGDRAAAARPGRAAQPPAGRARRARAATWQQGPRDLDVATASPAAAAALLRRLHVGDAGGLDALLDVRPGGAGLPAPRPATCAMLRDGGRAGCGRARSGGGPGRLRPARDYFLTQDGEPRKQLRCREARCSVRESDWSRASRPRRSAARPAIERGMRRATGAT